MTEKQRVNPDEGTASWLLSEKDEYCLERALKLEKTSLFFSITGQAMASSVWI